MFFLSGELISFWGGRFFSLGGFPIVSLFKASQTAAYIIQKTKSFMKNQPTIRMICQTKKQHTHKTHPFHGKKISPFPFNIKPSPKKLIHFLGGKLKSTHFFSPKTHHNHHPETHPHQPRCHLSRFQANLGLQLPGRVYGDRFSRFERLIFLSTHGLAWWFGARHNGGLGFLGVPLGNNTFHKGILQFNH